MSKIAVIGLGYVGLANAVLLAGIGEVAVMDICEQRRAKVAAGIAPFCDPDIEARLADSSLRLRVCPTVSEACAGAEFIVVAVPTNSAENSQRFDTSAVECVIAQAAESGGTIVIRSTVPIGFTEKMTAAHPGAKIIFAPEFSREGRSLHDCLFPGRIIAGHPGNGELRERAERFSQLLLEASAGRDAPVLIMSAAEAEATKLFANSYLAMRVCFFNELDSFAELRGLDTRNIIEGLGFDERIGATYNNPSFGYGGNCLPKDVRELGECLADTPGALIRSIEDANAARKRFIASQIATLLPEGGTVGVFRLSMKKDSDNFRQSAVCDVMRLLSGSGFDVRIYEPSIAENELCGIPLVPELDAFKRGCDVIVANRLAPELADVPAKVYTRDLFSRD